MSRQSRLFLVSLVSAALAVSGCAIHKPVTAHVVAYNRSVAEAHNRTLLLNVVRSMHRFPQQYTAVTDVRGTATSSLTPSLSLTLKNGDGTSGTPGLSAARSSGTSLVTVANLDDQEFFNGILNPVNLRQVQYYMDQGWPERTIGMLLVRRIRIPNDSWAARHHPKTPPPPGHPGYRCGCEPGSGETGPCNAVYENKPQEVEAGKDPFAQVKCFGARLLALREEGQLRVGRGKARKVGPPIDPGDVEDLGQLILDAKEDGLVVRKVGDSYQLFESAGPQRLEWEEGDDLRTGVVYSRPSSEQAAQLATAKEARRKGEGSKSKPKESPATFYFRSPLGIVYYLGEITRAQARGPAATADFSNLEPRICEAEYSRCSKEHRDEFSLLFVARQETSSDAEPFVSARWGGKTWVIPSCSESRPGDIRNCHRSMQVLGFLKQLIGLNEKSEAMPVTGVVTVAGG